MRRVVLILALMLAAPALAQPEGAAPDCPLLAPDCDRLPRLLEDFERDMAPMLRELQREAEPRLRDLERDLAPLLEGLGRRVDPFLRDLADLMGDLSGWEAPEVLPNGDILIRRRPGPPPPRPQDQAPEGPVTTPFEL